MQRIRLKNCTITSRFGAEIATEYPTTYVTELVRTGKIADPDFGNNAKQLYDTNRAGCDFITKIEVDEKIASYPNAVLILSGILGKAEIFFDGFSVGFSDSYGEEQRIVLHPYLTVGTHELRIRFSPQTEKGRVPEDFTNGALHPPILDFGLTGKAEILFFREAAIDTVRTKQVHKDGRVSLSIEVSTLGKCENVKAIASLTSPAGKIYYSGLPGGRGTVVIPDPEYWMPKTLGTPSLYRLGVALYADDEVADEAFVNVGLRSVTSTGFGQDDTAPYSMQICGVPFAFVGTDYAGEKILPCFDAKIAEKTVRDLVGAGISVLRFPASSGYPREELLTLCDRYGLCTVLELPKLRAEGRGVHLAEIKAKIDLFARHPSAILASSADAYDAELKNAVAEVAPDLLFDFLYVPSSEGQAPLTETDKNGTRKPIHGLLAHRPIPAFPTYEGWKTVLPEDQQNPFSAMADYRNPKGVEGQAKIISALSERGLAPYSAAQTCFATGVHAADEYTRAYSAFRAEKKDGVGFLCGIAREPWCSVGNALIDGKGNRRALYYAVKRSQGNVTLYAQRAGWRIGFTVENRRQTPYTGTVVASVTDAGNHVISKSQFNVTVPPMSVGQTESVDFSTIVFGKESEYFVSASVGDTAADSETFVYFCEPKCFALLQPTVTVSVSGGGKEFDLSVRSDVFVPNAEFSVSGVIADFDDNGFALTKVAPCRVHLTTAIPMTVEALCEKLSLITTYDVGRIQQTQLKIN